jgi:hypothetical protein
MIPAFERVKTVHALDCAATVIGLHFDHRVYLCVSDNYHNNIRLFA